MRVRDGKIAYWEEALPANVAAQLLPPFKDATERESRVEECELRCERDDPKIVVTLRLVDGGTRTTSFVLEDFEVTKGVTAAMIVRQLLSI